MIKICNKNIKVIICILKGPLFNECSVVVDAASIKMCAPSHTNDALLSTHFFHTQLIQIIYCYLLVFFL